MNKAQTLYLQYTYSQQFEYTVHKYLNNYVDAS